MQEAYGMYFFTGCGQSLAILRELPGKIASFIRRNTDSFEAALKMQASRATLLLSLFLFYLWHPIIALLFINEVSGPRTEVSVAYPAYSVISTALERRGG